MADAPMHLRSLRSIPLAAGMLKAVQLRVVQEVT